MKKEVKIEIYTETKRRKRRVISDELGGFIHKGEELKEKNKEMKEVCGKPKWDNNKIVMRRRK